MKQSLHQFIRARLKTSPLLAMALSGLLLTLGGLASPHNAPKSLSPVVTSVSLATVSAIRAQPDVQGIIRVMFIGASITDGYGSTGGHDYPSLVDVSLHSSYADMNTRRWAVPDAHVADALAITIPSSLQLAVVQLATNDAYGPTPTPLISFQSSYRELLTRIRDASPATNLICIGAWSDPGKVNTLGVQVELYDRSVQDTCSEFGGSYIDLSALYLDPSLHGPLGRPTATGTGDMFHPNDAGHARIAALILDDVGTLEPALAFGSRS